MDGNRMIKSNTLQVNPNRTRHQCQENGVVDGGTRIGSHSDGTNTNIARKLNRQSTDFQCFKTRRRKVDGGVQSLNLSKTVSLLTGNEFKRMDLMLLLALLTFIIPPTTAYLLTVDESQNALDTIFNASVHKLGSERYYKLNYHKSAGFVHRLIHVDPINGQVFLKEPLRCNSPYYPNLFTLYVDSTSTRLRSIDYYSLPLRIFIVGEHCGENGEVDESIHEHENDLKRRRRDVDLDEWKGHEEQDGDYFRKENDQLRKVLNKRDVLSQLTNNNLRNRILEAKHWVSETYASFAIPTTDKWQKICVKKSQYINSIAAFMPKSVTQNCIVNYLHVSDLRFRIEQSQGDLVASFDTCIVEPMWKVVITFSTQCKGLNVIDAEHRLKIVYHHQEFNDTDIARRIRRELRNQSPFFEQSLYIASVLEECDPGVIVTTVKARDPENSPVTYSMLSLIDSRPQSMFDIEPVTGTITTKVKLDRELIDVHYFRITATDDSFPPRSGTTTLQINVLDANDHTPVFEMTEYEASVREGVSVGTTVTTVKATDQDIGKNAEIEYSIEDILGGGLSSPEEDHDAFRIDGKTGVISTRTTLDRETTEVYTIVVQATDMASPQSARRSSSASVVVTVLDDNDNYPQFTERTYTVNVNEDINWTENPVIISVKATDADQGNNAALRFAIIGGNTLSQFSIDSLTGDITLVKALDYETVRNYRLVVRVQDGGSPSRSNTTQVLVNVKDVNDNVPRFYTSLFQETVSESVPLGYSIVRVQAYDSDEGVNAEIKYTISLRDSSGGATDQSLPVTVDPRSGWIYTTRELDREVQAKYMFHVLATDQGEPPQSASASVILTVQDVNDNDPSFERREYDAVVSEDDPPGTPVASVVATDPDEDPRIHYELTNGNTRGRFSITSQNGRGLITVAQPLDYKQEKRYVLQVTATDSGGRHDTTTVYVNVSDANNFAPVFENAPYTASVFEDAPIGTTVLVVSASDNDVGINAQITYSLSDDLVDSNNQPTEFTINSHTGAIITTKTLDREAISGYLLTVIAKDGGNPPLSDTTDVEISVTDVNDNYPTFKQNVYIGNILEDALVGTSVVQVQATDADIGLNGRIKYSLSQKDIDDGTFVIDPSNGVIRTNKGLDRESVALYQLEAIATDRGTPSLSTSVPVNIRIEDVNDNAPSFESDKIIMYIAENSPIGSTVGALHANDPDEGPNAIVQYSIIGGEDSNSFSLITGPASEKAELITMVELDYESSKKQYDLIIRAASPPLRTDVHVQIVVTDENDNAPVLRDFQIIFNNFKDYFPAGAVGRVPAKDADVTDQLQYRILSGNNAKLVVLNQTTGAITLSPQLNTNVPKLAIMEVSVTDGINEIKAIMQLNVRLVTEEMLLKSVTIRLNDMTEQAFLSPLLDFFVDGLAAIIPCPRENIFLFNIKEDTDVNAKILNVSFSARRPDVHHEEYYAPQFLQERVYLNRAILARLSTVQILPFDDNLCVREPCLNYEQCVTVLKFGNASDFIHSDTVLFRPIYAVTTFACRCPKGFTGSREHYLCDTEVNLCYSNPCVNNGTCRRKEGGYSCSCTPGFTGENCETELTNGICQTNPGLCRGGSMCRPQNIVGKIGFECASCPEQYYTKLCELKSRSFLPGSFLTFPSLKQRHRFHLKLSFATQSPNGLLLYNGRYNERHDFIALEIIDGNVEFSFSLGSNVTRTRIYSGKSVSDGMWHTVVVSYLNKKAIISLDDCDTKVAIEHGKHLGDKFLCANYTELNLDSRCSLLTETCYRFLDLTGPLQLGGLPNIPASFQIRSKHFSGCIGDFYVDYNFVDLNSYVADNGTVSGCPEKHTFCSSNPCQNSGVCSEGWATYHCKCPSGFSGKDCSEGITDAWQFFGDGTLSFNPLLRPIQLPWLNALSVRTRQSKAFLMSVQVGQNSSAVISIKDGNLQYQYNGEYLSIKSNPISDGQWHHFEIRWLGTEVSLSIDYDQKRTVIPFSAKIQGMFVGKIVVGAPDSTLGNAYIEYPFFEGCIQDVRIGNQQTLLNRPTSRENVKDGCLEDDLCLNPTAAAECPSNSRCVNDWHSTRCECLSGHVGDLCTPICEVSPCNEAAQCIGDQKNPKGYKCNCNSTEYSGDYCEVKVEQPCPGGWWGYPVCGPCACDETAGYHPDCNKTTGQCYCKENHYQPKEGGQCLPCDCYNIGSFGTACDKYTGQCECRPGVIGRQCQDCPNPYAEVTLKGCEVVYDGCPRNFEENIWWPRTAFGEDSVESCPDKSIGKAKRLCDNLLGGWQTPDLFNCTSERFIELRRQLSQLEQNELELNTYVAVKMSNELRHSTNFSHLYGSDVLITQSLIKWLIDYEDRQDGLTLTHSQDKDYVHNLMSAASVILDAKYASFWKRIDEISSETAEKLMHAINKYINVLSKTQHDTYTNPFEVVSPNIVLGLDIITAESIYGYEPRQLFSTSKKPNDNVQYTTETVILPDTSAFLTSTKTQYTFSGQDQIVSPMVTFPKYNNYLLDKSKFDPYTKIMIPLSLLGIQSPEDGAKSSMINSRAIVSYAHYKQMGPLLPCRYDESVMRRWGIDITVGSSILGVSVLRPDNGIYRSDVFLNRGDIDQMGIDRNDLALDILDPKIEPDPNKHFEKIYERIADDVGTLPTFPEVADDDTGPWSVTKRETFQENHAQESENPLEIRKTDVREKRNVQVNKNLQNHNQSSPHFQSLVMTVDDLSSQFNATNIKNTFTLGADDSSYSVNKMEDGTSRKFLYKSLNGYPLRQPIRLQMWLNLHGIEYVERLNPQCVHWSTARGFGEWSRVGCLTELDDNWYDKGEHEPLIVNCTCNHLSTFAVLVDVIGLEYIPEPSLMEDISTYSSFCISLPLLLFAWIILGLIRGRSTNSNSIHRNLVACVFLAELLYFVALKLRRTLVEEEVVCKLIAISLHYLWLGAFSWTLVDAIHLQRMLTEMRDVNHGHMRFYYTLGYALPAIIVGLSVGVRADQYGNVYFCWLSIYESVVWSLIGPICILVLITLFVLIFCLRAAFTIKDHVMGFGNLRTLLWVSLVSLPLLGGSWVLAVLSVAERLPILSYILSVAVVCHAVFCLFGYCFINRRVRQNLWRIVLRCMGRKVPLLETTSLGGPASMSSQNVNSPIARSALAYHNTTSFDAGRRNIGISTSSTTSRSTTKTSSSPYSRSDTQLRHTSTSTSNYNSNSDAPSYMKSSFEHEHQRNREVNSSERKPKRRGPTSESESSEDEERSLDLASSHSSDEDVSSGRRRHGNHRNGNVSNGTTNMTNLTSPQHERGGVGYLPNITENVPSTVCSPTVQSPPPLNILTNSQYFPNITPMYAPRWSSQLPEAYLPNVGRWSAETGSDNEILGQNGPSPTTLPNPNDITPETYLPKSHDTDAYMVKTQHYLQDPQYMSNLQTDYLSKLNANSYGHKLMSSRENFQEYAERFSEADEKQLSDKYSFPYTAEEDHCGSGNYTVPYPGRVLSPDMINDINNPGMMEYQQHHGSRMNSRLGSIMGSHHGSVHSSLHSSVCGSMRGRSPSPLVTNTLMRSNLGSRADLETDKNGEAETPV